MKKILRVAILAIVALSMNSGLFASSNNEAASGSKKLSVGIILPTKDEPRWIQDEQRFRETLEKKGYSVEILFSQADSGRERANVEALIAKGVDVLIMTPQDGAAAAAAAEEASKAGIKIISYDRLITNTDAVDYYVTFDSFSVGKAFGQYLVDNAKGTGNNLYLYAGAATDNNAFIFFDGAWTVLQPKIADGTFVIKNSSEAIALMNKNKLSRAELGKQVLRIKVKYLLQHQTMVQQEL